MLVALAAWAAFVVLERRPGAMAPLSMFRSRVFSAANLMTFLVYGALGAVLFFLVLQLQVTVGYGAIAAGVATLPIAVVMLFLSSKSSVLAARTGPRVPMTVGPLVCALGRPPAQPGGRRGRRTGSTCSPASCCSPSDWPSSSRR